MPSYLRRRGYTWFFRWKWPRRLAGGGGSGELIRSPKTADYRTARRRALMLALKIETMTSATDSLSRAELETAVRDWIDGCVWRREVRRAETRGVDFLTCEEIEKMGREEAVELDGLLSFASNMFAPEEKAAIGRVLTGKEPSDRYQPIVAAAAQEIGMAADPSTPAGRLVERTILRGYATLLDELRQEILLSRAKFLPRRKRPRTGRFYFHGFLERIPAARIRKSGMEIRYCCQCRWHVEYFRQALSGRDRHAVDR